MMWHLLLVPWRSISLQSALSADQVASVLGQELTAQGVLGLEQGRVTRFVALSNAFRFSVLWGSGRTSPSLAVSGSLEPVREGTHVRIFMRAPLAPIVVLAGALALVPLLVLTFAYGGHGPLDRRLLVPCALGPVGWIWFCLEHQRGIERVEELLGSLLRRGA